MASFWRLFFPEKFKILCSSDHPIDNVQILLACGTNTYEGITNDLSDVRCQHWLFTLNFKHFHVSVAVASIGSYLLFLDKYFYRKLFEIWTKSDDPNYSKFWVFWQKKRKKKKRKSFTMLAIFDILLGPFSKRFLYNLSLYQNLR